MNLTFSDEDRAFQRGVRDWFAANTPDALRRKVASRQMLNRDEIVHWQRRLDGQGYLVVGWLRHGARVDADAALPVRPGARGGQRRWACRWA